MHDPQTQLTAGGRLDGRWIVVGMLLVYATLLGVLTHSVGYANAWKRFGVPGLQPAFADLRVVTAGGDSYRAGHYPLLDNPEDVWDRPMDYPRVWLLPLLAFGLHQSDTVPLGIALTAAFFASVLLFMGRIRPGQGVWWGLLLCAPSTMLAVERGNNDLVIFILLALGLLALRREGARPWPAYLAVGVCAVLKLYPVCAFMLAWREKPRRALQILAVAALAFAAYLYATRDDLRALQTAVPRAFGVAYGSRVYFDWLVLPDEPHGTTSPLPALTALVAVIVAALGRVRIPGPAPLTRAEADGLMVGGAMYAATFVLNSNFNYRLVILLFTVPALLRLGASADVFYRRLGQTLLTAMTAGWLLSQMPVIELFLLKEACNWIVFIGNVFLLMQFLPVPSGVEVAGQRPVWRRLRWA